ncbi:two-component system, OmpR family, phosphate regulon sensor histidine kinase PhoR [Thermoactinomyces sp. DSM 45891]|uniref:two-component system histidine kinase PnpS n=1 Tax=Thermoactinomyces sp. DSM 45891 TaxID=1761907 RepID=UPI0009162B47|nr:HAMP domain-containing histidine kinase [Thermoactinomyces sp. DSM 45891]SFX59389.1 two-component system, OmpR family, phosphate regulon sensor histidine kinase PhoR [Thermoactinomyces sp. DSM 45891]
MKTFRARITSLFLFLIGCSVLGTGFFLALLLHSSYIDSLSSRLTKESKMIAEMIEWNGGESDLASLQQEIKAFGDTLEAHVTLYNVQGKVLGDSTNSKSSSELDAEWEQIRSQSNGLEVITIPKSDELIAAVPVVQGGKKIGVVRISSPLDEVNQSLSQVWLSLAGGLVIAYALAAFASSRVASSVTRPLEEMTQVAVDIAQKRFHRRVKEDGKDEIGRLGRAINRMAHSLQFQMETIRKSERRLTSVIESMESGLLMVNARGRVSIANKSFEQQFGAKPSEIVGVPYDEIQTTFDLSSLISRCAQTGARIREEIHLHHPVERILEANLAPMWVESNGIGVVAVFHDLTAIRRLEQMRKDFVANVSHELRTPITSIRGFSETLLDGAMQDPDTCEEFLKIILEESIRLQRLVGDLLDLSTIESKQMTMNFEQLSISSFFQNITKTLDEQARSKEQTLLVEIKEDFQIKMDPDRLKQVVLNLVGNAITYTPAGGEIRVQVDQEEKHWILIVSDTGMGIPEEDLGRIFERFYRVDKARSRESGGTGLGLAIVKHLVEEYEGEINVTSKVGEGTTFTIWFSKA